MIYTFIGSGLSSSFQALNLFASPYISFSSFCPRHLVIVELELLSCLLSFVFICEFVTLR